MAKKHPKNQIAKVESKPYSKQQTEIGTYPKHRSILSSYGFSEQLPP
jgi:hypothetical protein